MRVQRLWLVLVAAAAAFLLHAVWSPWSRAQTAGQPGALTGQVTSQGEGAMEGVVVTAKRAGSTISVSVISDREGRYSFPAGRLEPGQYTLRIRAVGYDLDGRASTDVTAGKTATADLKLRPTRNLSAQLTNAEWMLSMPGTEDQKAQYLNCVSCHTLERIVRSAHDPDEFTQTMARMAQYAQVSQPIKPQRRVDQSYGENPERFRKHAEHAASINLSAAEQWQYPLKTLPRPKGRATRVIITEYDLPRDTIEPHDVIVGQDGMVWYSNFGEEFLGKLDPKTGKHTEYALPLLKPGSPEGSLDLEQAKDGTFYLGMMYQGAVARFDPKAEKFQIFALPPEFNDDVAQLNMVTMRFDVDGKLWVDSAGRQDMFRLDLKSGKYEHFDPLAALPGGKKGHSIYDNAADSQNNLYLTDFQAHYVLRIDAKTGNTTYYQTPTLLARPRRVRMDDQDRLWFAEYRGNKIGMFNTKTEKFQEWTLPTPWTGPYYVTWDKNGELWTGGMTTDRVVRVDPKSGEAIEYLMPRDTNIRRVFVDNSTTPVTFWTGSNHGASIVKVEPLD
ncbi:MAG TPA: carboxypeptidase regulatory-like domain-containing protein [Alphaproteobacteria bacterium]